MRTVVAEAGGVRSEELLERLSKTFQRRVTNATSMLEEIERQRSAARESGLHFTTLTEDQLVEKLAKTKSPMIVYQSWSGTSSPGVINYTIGINNPDPGVRFWLFVHVFVGPANIAPDLSGALALVGERFPRMTEPEFAGLSVDPGVTAALNFSIAIPANIEPSNYLGNAVLFAATWHDPAEYLDRSLFVFRVT